MKEGKQLDTEHCNLGSSGALHTVFDWSVLHTGKSTGTSYAELGAFRAGV